MVEKEERTGRRTESGKEEGIGVPEMAYEEAKGRYDGTMGEGAEQVTLSACEEGTAEDKAGIPIAVSEDGIRLFRAQQPETPDVGEPSPGEGWGNWKEIGCLSRGAGGYGQERTRALGADSGNSAFGPVRPHRGNRW
jgi:hypothetical protein